MENQTFFVDTPAGRLYARPSKSDPDYPGIDIVLVNDAGQEINIAVIEHAPGGECCDGENHIPGDVIPEERAEYHTVTLWSGNTRTNRVLTPGIVARLWNDPEREDPITIAYPIT